MSFKYILAVLCFLYLDLVLACPMCAGSTNNQSDNYTVYVLIGFILAIYVPFYILFKTVYKHRNINKGF